jgi:2-desacetyl-2-hydroxyethyl bacteriochlorophyllide A dehydrogenase
MPDSQAIVFISPGRVGCRTIPLGQLADGQVRVRTLYSGVSGGTEGWVLQNRFTWAQTPFPCVPGYQRTGIIEETGPGVTTWQAGERVFATRGAWSGEIVPFWGSHIAITDTPEDEIYRVGPGTSDINAANTVVAQVGYNAASRLTDLEPGDWVLVLGDGLIGQSAAQAARARGAHVLLAGRRSIRLHLAQTYSADAVMNTREEDIASVVREVTGKGKVRFVLDSVQGEEVQAQYFPVVERGIGQIVYCGFSPASPWADMAVLQQNEITTHFVSGWTRKRIEATLALMESGSLNLEPLVTHLVPPSRAAEMYAHNQEKAQDFLGITFEW